MSGIPYHAWTHRPKAEGGTDPLPTMGAYDSALAYDAGVDGLTSVNNATLTTVTFDNLYVSIGATAFQINVAPAPATSAPFKILKDGWFFVGFNFEYAATFTDVRFFQVLAGSGIDTRPGMSASTSLTSEISSPYERECNATWLCYMRTQTGNPISAKVRQDSGSSKGVVAASLFLVYLGPDIDTDWPRPF